MIRSAAVIGLGYVGLPTAAVFADAGLDIIGVDVTLIVDGDNGFGNALNAQRTMRSYERAGASALQLEDQVSPKRCGHLKDKALISAARVAHDARNGAALHEVGLGADGPVVAQVPLALEVTGAAEAVRDSAAA